MTALLTETTRDSTARLNQELEEAKHEKLKRKVLRTLVPATDHLAGLVFKGCTWVRETLEEEGFEGRELAWHCEILLGGIESSLSGYDRLVAMAAESDLSPEAAGLGDLAAKLPALREARSQLSQLLTLAKRSPSSVDQTQLAESSASAKPGESVILNDDYIARVQAGDSF